MLEVKWTKEQSEAINTHGCNLLVAAAAGSGKTAVLVERIIKMITDFKNPVDIDRLLVVTFTNAAASEMKERIAKAIGQELNKHPKSRQLQRQLTLLNRASITTIHSFCLEVIRSNFHYIDLDPNFRIGDETENILLKGEVIEEMFEELYEPKTCTKEFLNLVEFFSNNKNDLALQNMIINLYNFIMSSPNPKELINGMAEDFNVDKDYDFGTSKWARILIEEIKIELNGIRNLMESAINVIENTIGLEPYLEDFRNELLMINDILLGSNSSWNSLYTCLENVKFKRLKSCKNCEDKDNQEKVKKIRDKVKKTIQGISSRITSYGSKDIAKDLMNLYPILKELSNLVIEFMNRYSEAKRERGIIDFNDFEHLCLEILSHEEVALRLRERYVEILVDEYQDSNYVQEAIINSIARKDKDTGKNNNIFMVGDVKQSIYRFRQAKPELFLKKYNSYLETEDVKERKITLFKNFRSRKEVLDGVNFIFSSIMSKDIGELQYNEKERLNLGADFEKCRDENALVGGAIELNLIEKDILNVEQLNNEDEILTNIQLEARIVAKKINELVNNKDGIKFKIYDSNLKSYRKVEYKDIVILLRSTSNWAPIFAEELKEKLIPAYADVGNGYFETLEIKTILSLLQIIDNPRQDIPFIAILRSPIASFTDEELIDIRIENKYGCFYDGILKIINSEDNDEDFNILREKCKEFIEKLKNWREIAIHNPIDEFIWYLYKDTGYYGYVGALSNGTQRQANLKILFQRARQYEKTSYKGLFNFINFINRLKVSNGDMGSAKILGENENVVRIMSIHKSKGLEFPVVILSGLGKNFNMQDLNGKLLFHNELGFGPEYIDIEKRFYYSTVLKEALKNKIKIENLSEEMRILYVALTRAKEKLILTGVVNDIKKHCRLWSHSISNKNCKISQYETLNAKNYLDWICPTIMRHKHGILLRQLAEIEEYELNSVHLKDESKWQIKLYDIEEYNEKSEEITNIEIDTKQREFGKYYEEIDRILNWQYPYIKSSKLPTLLTVTELKKMKNSNMYEDYASTIYTPSLSKKPKFMEENKKLTGAEKGTAMHEVMQKIDFRKELSPEYIKQQIEDMVNKELISKEQKDSIDIDKIYKFFKSSIGKRMIKANKVDREVPFHIQLKSTEVYKDLKNKIYEDEYIILQGIIDCYFEENNEIVIIDYKTDYFKEGEENFIVDRYKIQIEYYSKAIEKITNKKVKEKYLYLFYNNKEIEVK